MGGLVPATFLAFDDTDSPGGMCTTYLATLMLEEFEEFDLIGLPRLVRLNPNVPWKTRGNAAICLPLGKGRGESSLCGELDGREIRCYERGSAAPETDIIERAAEVLEKVACFDCDMTNPGIVVTRRRPPPSLYWHAVREVVDIKVVERTLEKCGAIYKKYKNGRGIIGASSAISWRPLDRTWEVISYRHEDRIGTPRTIDPDSVVEMDRSTRFTFNNYDYETGHVAIAPGSPCPVLFGIRGDSAEELLTARKMIRGEVPAKWLLFMSNQGTDDHIVRRRIGDLRAGDSASFSATVVSHPRTIPGGHTILRVSDGDEIDVSFYEPSKGLREVARNLIPGDSVVLYGSVRKTPRTLNVEKVFVKKLAREIVKVRNPTCERCGKSMGSLGRGQGYRCKKCGARASEEEAQFAEVTRAVNPGWYEPPVASRRHLYKPIRRMSRVNIDKI